MKQSSRSLPVALGLAFALSACGGRAVSVPVESSDRATDTQSLARSTAPSPLGVSPLARGLALLPASNQWPSGYKVFESDNWAGYAVVGTEFSNVRGSWIIPSIDCTVNPNGAASFWVGIDGWNNGTVEQTGTESQCNGLKAVAYAWYELFPKAGVTVTSVPVSPGDEMEASVHYNGAAFVVSITDLSTETNFTTSAAVARAKRASAEWITESNGSSGLPDFDVVDFGKDFTGAHDTNAAVDSTTSGPIAAFGNHVQVAVMGNKKRDEAVPSILSSDGTSFAVTYWNP